MILRTIVEAKYFNGIQGVNFKLKNYCKSKRSINKMQHFRFEKN